MVQFIPKEELLRAQTVQWAPMVDFLFIVIIVFATIALTRNLTVDQELELVLAPKQSEHLSPKEAVKPLCFNVSVSQTGQYQWMSESSKLSFESARLVGAHLKKLQRERKLPQGNRGVTILLHIDKSAPWQPIADVILAIRETGYEVHPVYRSCQ